MSSICLNMIVKDEAAIITDTLENLLQHIPISYWVIADTGSSDDTPKLIRQFFDTHNIPGELIFRQWENFGRNRQQALEAAQGKTDYVFFFDADDRISGTLPFNNSTVPLHADAYAFKMHNQNTPGQIYDRRLLVRNNGMFRWRGAVHEQIDADQAYTQILVDGSYSIISGRFGARSRNSQRYLEDARILEKSFSEDDNPHLRCQNAFFCGQSYRDAGMYEEAAHWFQICIGISDPGSELRRYALMQSAQALRKLGRHESAAQQWLSAAENSPHHPDALVFLAEYELSHRNPQRAFEYARQTLTLPQPDLATSIALRPDIYRYGRHNAYLRAALALHRWEDAWTALKHLLSQPPYTERHNLYFLSVLQLAPILDFWQQEPETGRLNLIRHIQTMPLSEEGMAVRNNFLKQQTAPEYRDGQTQHNSISRIG